MEEEGFKIGDGGEVIVDPVGTGKQSCRCRRQDREARHHVRHPGSRRHDKEHIPHHAADGDRLNEESRRGIVELIFLHGVHIARAAVGIAVDKVVLLAGDLDLLDAGHGFLDPLVETAVIVLIVLAGTDHDRLDRKFDDEERDDEQRRDGDGHHRIGGKEDHDQADKDDRLAGKLQAAQDQAVHIVDVGRDAPLDHGGIRIEIILIGALHEIDHHPPAGGELIRVDKSKLHDIHEVEKDVLDDKGDNEEHHEESRELLGILQAQSVVQRGQECGFFDLFRA